MRSIKNRLYQLTPRAALIWVIFVVVSLPAIAQQEITSEQWEQIVQDRSYQMEEEEVEDQVEANDPSSTDFSGLSELVKPLAYLLVIGVLVALIYVLIQRQQGDEAVEARPSYALTDELLSASAEELDDQLSQNIRDGNYRNAVRFRFGQLLQALRSAGLLSWSPGKTNREFQQDLPEQLRRPFGELAKQFDYAYYAGKPVDLEYYTNYREKVTELQEQFTTQKIRR